MPWHAQRDTFVEFAGWLSLVTGTLGKMAQDVILLTQTEVGEAGEQDARGGGAALDRRQELVARHARHPLIRDDHADVALGLDQPERSSCSKK